MDFWALSPGIFLGSYTYTLAYMMLTVTVTWRPKKIASLTDQGRGGKGRGLSKALTVCMEELGGLTWLPASSSLTDGP